jgi:hypothetical protein
MNEQPPATECELRSHSSKEVEQPDAPFSEMQQGDSGSTPDANTTQKQPPATEQEWKARNGIVYINKYDGWPTKVREHAFAIVAAHNAALAAAYQKGREDEAADRENL